MPSAIFGIRKLESEPASTWRHDRWEGRVTFHLKETPSRRSLLAVELLPISCGSTVPLHSNTQRSIPGPERTNPAMEKRGYPSPSLPLYYRFAPPTILSTEPRARARQKLATARNIWPLP